MRRSWPGTGWMITELTESPSSSATSFASQPSTSRRISTARPRARREVLDGDQVRQLDRLPRDGDGLRLVRVVGGQLVEQPVRVGPGSASASSRSQAAVPPAVSDRGGRGGFA